MPKQAQGPGMQTTERVFGSLQKLEATTTKRSSDDTMVAALHSTPKVSPYHQTGLKSSTYLRDAVRSCGRAAQGQAATFPR